MLEGVAGKVDDQELVVDIPAVADRAKRKALGIYYTPPAAAQLLASWAIRDRFDVVLEPSFGGCALLAAAIDAFRTLGIGDPSDRLIGYDVDPAAFAHLARLGVSRQTGIFLQQDFLRSAPSATGVTAVLANPPFVSYHRMSASQRRAVRDWRNRYEATVNQRASLWAYFVLHAMHHLANGGRLAFVAAGAMQSADYARPLLGKLRAHFNNVQILHVSEQLFIQDGADERVSLIFADQYSREPRREPGALKVHHLRTLEGFAFKEHQGVGECNDVDSLQLAEQALARTHASFVDLGSRCRVEIGEVVGATKFFVRSKEEWRSVGVPASNLKPLLLRSTQAVGLSVKKADVRDRIPLLLLPPPAYRSSIVQTLLAYWTPNRIEANSTLRKRQKWFRCSYRDNADAFIASLSHLYPRLIGNAAGISCANGFYKVKANAWPELVPWLPLVALTSPFRLSAELHGRIRGAGALKLEPSDVRKLSIPVKLPMLEMDELQSHMETIESAMEVGSLPTAMRLADMLLYENQGLLDRSTLEQLTALCDELVQRRLAMRSDSSAQV